MNYMGIDLGTPIPAIYTIQIKTCKSGRHVYHGYNRCIACKREYDRAYHARKRQEKKRYRDRMVWLLSQRPPVIAANSYLKATI